MSKSIFGLVCLWFFSLNLKAEQPIFTITTQDATHGQIIDVDFHVDNFTSIISVQYSVNWDPAVLKFRTLKNFNTNVPGLNSSVFGTSQNLIDQGIITLAWFESSITPITIPDGSLFYTIEFEVLGNPCDHSSIAITDNPTEIGVTEEPNDVQVGLVSNNGAVNVPGTGCTSAIELVGNSVVGSCGSQVCVEFKVNNFVNVGVMEFSLVFDPNVIEFDTFQNFAPLMGFGNGNVNHSGPGELRVVWFNGNVVNETLPDGTVLFDVCFNVIGSGGQSSTITFGNNPAPTFSDTDEHVYEVNITPATISAQCTLQGFALIADTVCTQPGGIVCMDVKVNDFTDIVEMQFSMNWDSTKFTFDHVEGFGLAGLDEMAFGTPLNSADHKEGRISVSWLDLSLNGVTLPDLTTIFRLCLKAKGAVGTGSAVNFTSDPLEIEVSTLDSVLVYGLIQGRAEIKQSCMGCSVSYGIDARNPLCRGAANGVIDLTVVEDCPENPTYVWNTTPPSTTEDLSGLAAGTYTVTITVGTQVIIASATLDDPAPFGSTVTITDPSPPGSATGAINITITGGTPPYHYQWSTPPGSTTEDISNLLAGTYSVTVTDNNGCTYVPNSFVVGADMTASVTNVSCNGGNNGAINLTVTFGTGPYTFNWNTTPPTTTEDLNNLVAGTYCVTVTDNGGSTRDSCFTITQPTALNVTATVTPDALQNCQGAIDLNVTGGTQPYSYLWSNAAPSQDLIGLCAGRYCVTVTDGNGCTVSQCFDITSGNFNVSLTAQQHNGYQTTCSGSCDGQVTSNVSGGTAPFTYHWGNNQSTANLNNLCAGTYALTVTDASGQTATASIVINAPPAITIDVTTTLPTDFNSNDGAASAIVNGGRPPYSYHWDGPVDFNTAAGSNLPGGTYILTVTDANGCEATKLVSLFPEGGPGCYQGISVITPNSDGKNDYFIISCVLDANNHLFIFNRAGGLVYETDNYQNNWIGVDQNNEPVPDGGYLWVLEVFGPNGSKILYKGTVVLLRTAD